MTLEQCDWPLTAPIAVLVDGKHFDAVLLRWDESPEDVDKVRLELHYDTNIVASWSEDSYFRALIDIRIRLGPEVLVSCYGSSENVYPSPMIESMGYGEKAYKLTVGKPALMTDLVSIFDVGSDVIPSTVSNQKKYYESWLKSLR